MEQWWEHLPPTNVARARFPDSVLYLGWVCCFCPCYERFFPLKRARFYHFAAIISGVKSNALFNSDVPCESALRVICVVALLLHLVFLYFVFSKGLITVNPGAVHLETISPTRTGKRTTTFTQWKNWFVVFNFFFNYEVYLVIMYCVTPFPLACSYI